MGLDREFTATIKSYTEEGDYLLVTVDLGDTVSNVAVAGKVIRVPLSELTGVFTEDITPFLRKAGFPVLTGAVSEKDNQDRIVEVRAKADLAINKIVTFYSETSVDVIPGPGDEPLLL